MTVGRPNCVEGLNCSRGMGIRTNTICLKEETRPVSVAKGAAIRLVIQRE